MIPKPIRRVGGGLNRSPLNSAKINARYSIWLTESAGGTVISSGAASLRISKYPTVGGTVATSGSAAISLDRRPDVGGVVVSSGHSSQVYAQLQVVGGDIYYAKLSAKALYGHVVEPIGSVEISGTAQARPVIQVQIMHTDRTVVVPAYDTEVFVEDLFNEVTVVRTEDRQADIPAVVDFYI